MCHAFADSGEGSAGDCEYVIADWAALLRGLKNLGEFAYQLTPIPDVVDCAGGDGEACAWMAAGFIPGVRGISAADNMADASKATSRGGEAACKISSFVPGTKVLMADGTTKPIEKVKVGDKVLATDPTTGQTEPKTVVGTITTQGRKDLVKLTIDSDGLPGDKTGTVVATANHPIWVPGAERWSRAGDLQIGDELRTPGGTPVEVKAVDSDSRYRTVHNLTIAGIHTYYVMAGHMPVLVHNQDGTAEFIISGDYEGRVDRFTYRGQEYFEVHVYYKGNEVGIYGSNGWIGKHGHPANMNLDGTVENRLKGIAIDEMRRAHRLNSGEDIKGDAWKRPHVGDTGC